MTKFTITTFIKQALNKLSYISAVLMVASPLGKLPATTEGGVSHVNWSGCDL